MTSHETSEERAQIEKMLEDAIGDYRHLLDPDVMVHVRASFSQLLHEWSRDPRDEPGPCGEPPSAP